MCEATPVGTKQLGCFVISTSRPCSRWPLRSIKKKLNSMPKPNTTQVCKGLHMSRRALRKPSGVSSSARPRPSLEIHRSSNAKLRGSQRRMRSALLHLLLHKLLEHPVFWGIILGRWLASEPALQLSIGEGVQQASGPLPSHISEALPR